MRATEVVLQPRQRILIESFKTLASEIGWQVLLTTHSPGFASELPTASIRFVTRADGCPVVQEGADVFGQVAETLVYLNAPGAVMRCRTCTSVLAVVVSRQEINCVDLSGLAALQAG